MAKLFDLSPLEEKEIIESGELTIENITYKSQDLGDDLVMIFAYINGERQRSSIGVQKSTIEYRIQQYKLKEESLTKQFQIRLSQRLYNDIEKAAKQVDLSVADFIRVTMQTTIEKMQEETPAQ